MTKTNDQNVTYTVSELDTLLAQARANIPVALNNIIIRKIMMTPELALILLNNFNKGNRFKNKRFISVWAQMIIKQLWLINGDTLSIDWDGNLLDGQHRLEAIIEADIAVPMIVISNLNPNVYTTKDCGKPRTTKDTFDRDGKKHSAKRAAVTNVLDALQEKDLEALRRNPSWAAKYIFALYNNNVTAFDSISYTRKYQANDRLVNGVYVYFLIYSPQNTQKIHRYFAEFYTGLVQDNKQPYLMREWLIRNVHSNNDHTTHKTIVKLLIKSINKFLIDCKDKTLINNKNLICEYIH